MGIFAQDITCFERNVRTSSCIYHELNNSPHNVAVFTRNSSAVDPIITNQASIDQANFMYVENNASEWLPGKGSLVFVRLKPVPLAGGGGASSG